MAPSLKLVKAKKENTFSQIQRIYDLTKKLADKDIQQKFLVQAKSATRLRDEFSQTLDLYHELELEEDENYVPNFSPLNAVDEMCNYISKNLEILETKIQTAKDKDKAASDTSASNLKASPRLPKLEICSFDGTPEKWPVFYQLFQKLIHQNESLSDLEKINYLVTHLQGPAKAICTGVVPTAENYKTLFDSLVQRYEDKRLLASAYLSKVLEFKPISQESEKSLNLFLEHFVESVIALQQLNLPNLAEFIFVHIALKKLDLETSRNFEMAFRKEDLPSFEDLVGFLREQAKILSRTKRTTFVSKSLNLPKSSHSFVVQNSLETCQKSKDRPTSVARLCVLCGKGHLLYCCPEFHKKSVDERWMVVKECKACFNCLSVNRHRMVDCESKRCCSTCQRKHHSLLHHTQPTQVESLSKLNSKSSENKTTANSIQTAEMAPSTTSVSKTFCSSSLTNGIQSTTVLLATAQVIVNDSRGNPQVLRALIDNGSQSHLISPEITKRLGLTEKPFPSVVRGLGAGLLQPKTFTTLNFSSRVDPTARFGITALVTDFLEDHIPSATVPINRLAHLRELPLADPTFYEPGRIDLLLGAALWPYLIKTHKVFGPPNTPTALETSLGYIVMGNLLMDTQSAVQAGFCAITENASLDHLVQRFWALEEVPTTKVLNADERQCEEHFLKTFKRDINGKFSVALPFKQPPSLLGSSRRIALNKYISQEKRLRESPDVHLLYAAVMQEYLEKNYMSWVGRIHQADEEAHYLPHHAVLKPESSSTPLRIVFNASSPTSNKKTLNSLLHVGPKLYPEIFDLLLNFRLFKFALSADVSKMYLQIKVHPEFRKFQRLIWKPLTEAEPQIYELNTVVFGFTSSPYLAQRVIHLLADLEKSKYPIAAEIAHRDVYMDDIVTSTPDQKSALEIYHQLKELFDSGGFKLAKWCSNSLELMRQVPEELKLQRDLRFEKEMATKVLGVKWSPQKDILKFEITMPEENCTKRSILSLVARTFDPLGLLAPVMIAAKLIIQELWSLHIDWDDSPPSHIIEQWNSYCKGLPMLGTLEFSRHSSIEPGAVTSLIGFADASEKAYGAAVYIRTSTANEIQVKLLCAKSRVAPLKTKSIPRLELCAALLLSRLMRHIIDLYKSRHVFNQIIAFSDSTVTLHWINSNPSRWKVFVCNRIAQIQENLESKYWRYVPGKENPSDCLTRGLNPESLLCNTLWFHGPSWLKQEEEYWPPSPLKKMSIDLGVEEAKIPRIIATTLNEPFVLNNLLERVSTYKQLLKITVYVLRFVRRKPVKDFPITLHDINNAEEIWIKHIQKCHFSETIENLKKNKLATKNLRHLNPFLENGLLRVGGRLHNSDLPYNQRHPMLLPKNNLFVDLLIDQYHKDNLHTGAYLLISLLNQKYWIISMRIQVRKRVRLCNTCFKANPKPIYQKMAPLPQLRVQQAKAFTHTGVDYAGPFTITTTRRRGGKTQKAYICLFVCLAVKALHIELVTELSTNAFLDAFKRFLSRRGPCAVLLSDCGTNFIGAKNQLDELSKFVVSRKFHSDIETELVKRQVEWRFNPPAAPHFGGIWESNVKSVKSHLKRVMGQQVLTYEELNTLLIQIEALLNSRPLCTLRNDPNSPTALTPAHFLTLGPTLDYLPAKDVSHTPLNRLNRHQLIDNLLQGFWKRWHNEYLHSLQSRRRWTGKSQPLIKGTVVVLKKENLAPLQWPLGVIEETFPGKDDIVRVVDIRTKDGIYRRPVTKICPLPTQ